MSLLFRAPEPHDLDQILRWENDTSAWDYSDVVAPLSSKIVRDYIATYDADPMRAGQLRLIITPDNDPLISLGMADLYDINPIHAHAMVGIYVDESCRNSGVGITALRMLCQYANQRLGIRTLAAMIEEGNQASAALFAKAGFRHCGTLPNWRRTALAFRNVNIWAKQ